MNRVDALNSRQRFGSWLYFRFQVAEGREIKKLLDSLVELLWDLWRSNILRRFLSSCLLKTEGRPSFVMWFLKTRRRRIKLTEFYTVVFTQFCVYLLRLFAGRPFSATHKWPVVSFFFLTFSAISLFCCNFQVYEGVMRNGTGRQRTVHLGWWMCQGQQPTV